MDVPAIQYRPKMRQATEERVFDRGKKREAAALGRNSLEGTGSI